MKIRRLLTALCAVVLLNGSAEAQLVSDQIFLQGRWLEVGVAPNGSWGNAVTVPAGYHSHTGAFPSYTSPVTGTTATGNGLDFSYDAGHDGWTVGTPASATNCCFYGAYFLPGTPFDGWAIQMNGVRSDAYYTTAGFALGAGATTFTGTNVGYAYNAGTAVGPYLQSNAIGTWSGNYAVAGGTLAIRTTNRVDTNASWDLVNVTFRNTGATPITGLYYLVTADPDNDVTIPGSYPTDNHIVHQGDAQHRVAVQAVPPSGVHPDAVSGIATKDCRAKAIIYQSWPSAITVQLSDMWAGTTPATASWYTSTPDTTTISQDIAYGIVYNLGNLAPGDSTTIAFAWYFNDSTAVDSAFQEPRLDVNGSVAGGPNDTFSRCGFASPTIPLTIVNGEWGVTNWKWSPATGLSATTGTSVTLTLSAISSAITYTITGTDTASCNHFELHLYIPPCHSASSNSPDTAAICEGDTLHLYCHGDSLGATYEWYGPGLIGATIGATQNTFKHPSTMADTGWYYVIKTVGSVADTARTHVMIKKRPYVTATYNPPVCSGSSLLLYSNPDYAGETWSWTGPLGYTSTVSDPTIPGAITGMSGDYKVITNLNGCIDSATVTVAVDTTPVVPIVGSNSPVCADSTLFLTSSTATPGVTYSWSGPSGFTSTLQNPSIPSVTATTAGTYSVTVRRGTCTSTASTIVSINVTPTPILGSNSPVCSGGSLNLTATGLPGSTFAWSGPLGFTSTLQYPSISPAITSNSGTYSVVVTLAGCPSQIVTISAVVDSTPEVPVVSTNSPGPPGATICQEDTLLLFANSGTAGVSYSWTGPNSFTSFAQNPIIYGATPLASGVYTVVVGLGSCTVQATIAATVTPTPPITLSSNSPICSGDADSVKLFATSNPGATFTWTGPYTFFSGAQNPVRTPVSTEHGGTYIATVLWEGCTNQTSIKVVVNQTPTPPWVKWLTYCQYYDAPYLQAVGSNLLWYTSAGGAGSTAPPKPPTDVVGIKFYWVNQTVMNCPSALDSIRVVVNPTPSVTVSSDTTVCPWDSVMLTAVNPDVIAYYKWYPSMYLDNTTKSKVTVRPETNMEYFVVSTNMYGCTDTASVRITVKENAVLHLPDSVQLFPGESYQIEPSTNCTKFSWTPSGGLSGKFIANPLASPEVSTKYVLTGETEWGCISRDSIKINIADESVITIPNAFAPGSVNNLFKPHLRGQAVLKYFRIFDRWGVMVYESTQMGSAGWDGTYKGVPQPVGVYVYEVSAVSGTGKVYNKVGNVTLLR